MPDLDTTPGVQFMRNIRLSNTAATSVTDFAGGLENQIINLDLSNVNTTIVHAAGVIRLAAAVDFL